MLLNFLLAIIVDAFSEVKEQTNETVGIHTELFMLLRDKWRGMLGRCSPNYISDKKLGALLRQWAGEEDKDAANAARMAELEQAEKLITVRQGCGSCMGTCMHACMCAHHCAEARACAGWLARVLLPVLASHAGPHAVY